MLDAAYTAWRTDLDAGRTDEIIARTVLYHPGAEASAHEVLCAEQERWISIAQLAAEYETLAAAAQHDRWTELIRRSGLDRDQAEAVFASDAFGTLAAELRHTEADGYDVDVLLGLPRSSRRRWPAGIGLRA